MAVAKRAFEKQSYAEVLEFFTPEEVQNNLTFLMLVDFLIRRGVENSIIQVIDPEDETNVLYYTNDKFLEVIDTCGLNGFIYWYEHAKILIWNLSIIQ